MTKTDLLTLAYKCEAADASEQRELLEACKNCGFLPHLTD